MIDIIKFFVHIVLIFTLTFAPYNIVTAEEDNCKRRLTLDLAQQKERLNRRYPTRSETLRKEPKTQPPPAEENPQTETTHRDVYTTQYYLELTNGITDKYPEANVYVIKNKMGQIVKMAVLSNKKPEELSELLQINTSVSQNLRQVLDHSNLSLMMTQMEKTKNSYKDMTELCNAVGCFFACSAVVGLCGIAVSAVATYSPSVLLSSFLNNTSMTSWAVAATTSYPVTSLIGSIAFTLLTLGVVGVAPNTFEIKKLSDLLLDQEDEGLGVLWLHVSDGDLPILKGYLSGLGFSEFQKDL